MNIRIEVIGGVRASIEGQPVKLRRQVQRFVAILVAAGPAGIEASALAEELWTGAPPDRWNAAVRNALTALRAETHPDIVLTSSSRYSLQCATDQVDAWRVLDAASAAELDLDRVGLVGRFVPFDGLEITPLLREMSDALHSASLRLIDRISTTDDIRPEMLASLIAAVRNDPFAEPMAVATVSLLLRLKRNDQAVELIDHIQEAFETDLGVTAPQSIIALRRSAEGATAPIRSETTVQPTRSLPSLVADLIQKPIAPLRYEAARTLADEITQQHRARRLAIVGPSGSGKSRFIAEVGHRLHDTGSTVLFAVAIGDNTNAYSPFLTASPAFRRRYLELVAPEESTVWSLWSSIVDDLGAQGRPITLIVDDAQWLDRRSIRLLEFVHRMQPTVPITTIIVGRPTMEATDWSQFEAELLNDDRSELIDLPPLGIDDLVDLVRQRWPRRSEAVYLDAAAELTQASGGLPMVALLLVESLAGPTLQSPARRTGQRVDVATDRLRTLEPTTQETLAAASALGATFSADEIAALLERDPHEVDDAIEDAIRNGVLIDLEVPGTYRFVHDLLRGGATKLASRATFAAWCASLSAVVGDPVRRAQLVWTARTLFEAGIVAEQVAAGARAALDRGLTRLAVELAQHILQLDAGFEHDALASLALAQVRLGALDEAASTRTRMLDSVDTAEQHVRATEVLLASVGVVETDHPTSIRVGDFDHLDTAPLDHDLQFARALTLARLAIWEGDRSRRDDELVRARALVDSANEEGQLFYAEWRCGVPIVDDTWFEQLQGLLVPVDDQQTAANLHLCEALELLALGRWDEAEASAEQSRQVATDWPEQQWLAQLAAATCAFARGDLGEARRRANEAYRYGSLFALPLAPSARAAQSFSAALQRGTVETWLTTVESQSPQLLRATLAIAAVGRARYEAGLVDEAWKTVEPIIDSVLSGQPRLAVSTIAVVAPLLRRKAPPSVRQRCIELVREAGDRWVITASGIGVHGPATRILAILEGDRRGLQLVRSRLTDNPMWAATLDRDIAKLDEER